MSAAAHADADLPGQCQGILKRPRHRFRDIRVTSGENNRVKGRGAEGSLVMHPSPQLNREEHKTQQIWVIHRSPARFRPKPRQLKSIWI